MTDANRPGPTDAGMPARRGRLAWLAVPGLLLLGAGVRALRFAAPFHWPFHWDEAQVAMPALQVLGGSLPANVVGPEYFGATSAYRFDGRSGNRWCSI